MDAELTVLRRNVLLLIPVCLILFFVNLGVPGLWDEDEPRNATCAREMLEAGNWIVPTFNGELRTAKPVLLYWLIMSAYSVFGISEFSARFWSALLSSGTVLLTCFLGTRFYSGRVGLWSGLLLGSSLMFVVAARACTPDALLVFFVTAALATLGSHWCASRQVSGVQFANINLEEHRPLSRLKAFLAFSFIGLAMLAKGPVGIVLPGTIVAVYLLVSSMLKFRSGNSSMMECLRQTLGSWKWCREQMKLFRLGIGLPLLVMLVIPWYVAVAWETDGAWVRQFLGAENVGRFLKPMEGHRGPVVYYLVAILIGFYPASVFLPYGIVLLFRRLRCVPNSADLFLFCWAGVWIGFFSLAGTKLPSYVTPSYPALAILTAKGIVSWLDQPQLIPRWATRVAYFIPVLTGIGLCVALPLLSPRYLAAPLGLMWVGIIPLLFGTVSLRLLNGWQLRTSAGWFMAGGIAFSAALFGFAAVQVDREQSSEALFTEVKKKYPDLNQVGTFRFTPPSFVFYAGHPLKEFRTPVQAAEFLSNGDGRELLIVREPEYRLIQDQLPGNCSILIRKRRFLKNEELLVIGSTEAESPGIAAGN